ncbi:MAG: hypothetical protein MZU84_09460 [Sphingobacterium sp.]|nr:hypothetical protein [Sphingobacterium sp.]
MIYDIDLERHPRRQGPAPALAPGRLLAHRPPGPRFRPGCRPRKGRDRPRGRGRAGRGRGPQGPRRGRCDDLRPLSRRSRVGADLHPAAAQGGDGTDGLPADRQLLRDAGQARGEEIGPVGAGANIPEIL